MKLCKQCNSEIPNCIYVDGRRRNLQNRTLCLTCLPFGSENSKAFAIKKAHNIKHSRQISAEQSDCCVLCNKPRGKSLRLCNSCVTKVRRYLTKQKAVEYLGGKCKICGWSGDQAGFDFHHKDPSQKDFAIGDFANIKWERVLNEIKKCELLCRTCHSIEHSTRNNTEFLKEVDIMRKRSTIYNR